jgi:Methylamine utilisation protein MauE
MRLALQVLTAGYALFLSGAALAKLDRWSSWSSAASGWLPAWLPAKVARFGLPVVELLTAIVLIAAPTVGLVLAAALLGVFGIAVALLSPRQRGRECGCFGALMPSRIGTGLAVRDLALAVAAAVAALLASRSAVERFELPAIFLVVLVGALGLLWAEDRRVRRIGQVRPEVTP